MQSRRAEHLIHVIMQQPGDPGGPLLLCAHKGDEGFPEIPRRHWFLQTLGSFQREMLTA
jgi:hypothetical protein